MPPRHGKVVASDESHLTRHLVINLAYCALCIGYLARAFGRCHEELQSVRRREGKADVSLALKALEVARTQLVSFSATCLMEVRKPHFFIYFFIHE